MNYDILALMSLASFELYFVVYFLFGFNVFFLLFFSSSRARVSVLKEGGKSAGHLTYFYFLGFFGFFFL
jgi:hypothetical protein